MPLSEDLIKEITYKLLEAEGSCKPIDAITTTYPGITLSEARKINFNILNERIKKGEKVIGFKVAFTSKAMQQAWGVDKPEWGYLTSGMVVADGGEVETKKLIQPRIEPEIAFLLKDDVKGPGVSAADIVKATAGVLPAIEIVDSRVAGKRKVEDFVADSSGAARVVLGGNIKSIDGLDLKLVGCVVEIGEVVATATGAAALGNPVNSMVFIANAISEVGDYLKAGQIVITGSLVTAIPVKAGDYVKVSFDRIGSVSVKFI
ncbi:MAG: 2-oxopent-4-enoate hydratase [Sulfolobales archaeon]|nr:2-oxopent-4-enoate hydratase [Sulfolobales archaeon]MCX8186118.1 2-oxopent-4-enoate hydratase [Sulfolobales archaeon]MDW7969413.1 2-oxopent-4-enoate hydratase [Sulfolobales archaeon]